MRIKLFGILTIISFVACDPATLLGPEKQAATYFPLKVGNTWTYSGWNGTGQLITYEIFEQKMIGGHVYFAFGSSPEYAEWIRISGGMVYKLVQGMEKKWLDFTKNDGEKYIYRPGFDNFSDNWDVHVRRDRTVEYEIGQKYTYLNCADFFFDLPGAVDDEHGFVFAPGVGIVKFYGAWVNLYLQSYSIQE